MIQWISEELFEGLKDTENLHTVSPDTAVVAMFAQ